MIPSFVLLVDILLCLRVVHVFFGENKEAWNDLPRYLGSLLEMFDTPFDTQGSHLGGHLRQNQIDFALSQTSDQGFGRIPRGYLDGPLQTGTDNRLIRTLSAKHVDPKNSCQVRMFLQCSAHLSRGGGE